MKTFNENKGELSYRIYRKVYTDISIWMKQGKIVDIILNNLIPYKNNT